MAAKPYEIYVCCALSDDSFRVALEKHLAGIRREASLRIFSARSILPAQNIAEAVELALARASLVIFLLSADFFNNDECLQAVSFALRRQANDSAKLVAILVRACDWCYPPFDNLSVLPPSRRPVSSWRRMDEVWVEIVDRLRSTILCDASLLPVDGSTQDTSPNPTWQNDTHAIAFGWAGRTHRSVENRRLATLGEELLVSIGDDPTNLDRIGAFEPLARTGLRELWRQGYHEIVVRLALALGFYWRYRGPFVEGNKWIQQALRVATQPADRSKLLYATGILDRYSGRYIEGLAAVQAKQELDSLRKDELGVSFALEQQAMHLLRAPSGAPEALRRLHSAYAILEGLVGGRSSLDLAKDQVIILCTMSDAYSLIGQPHAAEDYVLRAAEISHAARLPTWVRSKVAHAIGGVLRRMGRMDEAKQAFQEALHMRETASIYQKICASALSLAEMEILTGNHDRAKSLLAYSHQLAQSHQIRSAGRQRQILLARIVRSQGGKEELRQLVDSARSPPATLVDDIGALLYC